MQQRLAIAGVTQELAMPLASGGDLIDQLGVQLDPEILPPLALQLGDGLIGAMDARQITEHGDVHVDLRREYRTEVATKFTNRHVRTSV
jgi:hypothetical protein